MPSRKQSLSPAIWEYCAQCFVGLFFLTAAYLKATQTFFGAREHPLHDIFEYWLRIGWPLDAFRPFMQWGMGHADAIAVGMITSQALLGLLLILNIRLRLAGALLLLLHIPLLLSVYHQSLLFILIFQTFWVGAFYVFKDHLNGRGWRVMTIVFVLISALFLYQRATVFQDVSFESVPWQRKHFSEHVMSLTVGIKHLYLWLTAGNAGALLWVASWWFKLGLTIGILTRYRLQIAACWLVFLIWSVMVWMSEWTCEGVFWILFLFVWMTHESALQQRSKKPPVSFLA